MFNLLKAKQATEQVVNGITIKYMPFFFFFQTKGQKSVFIWLGDYPVFEQNVTYSFHLSFKVR